MTDEIPALAARLAQANDAVPAGHFPADQAVGRQPGLYAWFADDVARAAIGRALDTEMPVLIYAGQAGATKQPSGTLSAATLRSRIAGQHVRGNTRSSTFRRTIAAVLRDELDLQLAASRRLTRESNERLTAWIVERLSVVGVPVTDRDRLGEIEASVLRLIDPPLNINHVSPTPARTKLRALRGALVLDSAADPAP